MRIKSFRYILNWNRYLSFESRKKKFFKLKNKREIIKYQLDKFNEVWEYAYSNFSIYKNWLEDYKLPKKLKSLDELSSFPELSKNDLKEYLRLNDNNFRKYPKILTGGSSGNLLQFPYNKNDIKRAFTSISLARKNIGNSFLCDYVMIWGHSHLLGSGIKRYKNLFIRSLKDFLQGITRISAYDLSNKSLVKCVKRLKKLNNSYVITYSSYLRLLSRTKEFKKFIKYKKLKFILTSEVIEDEDMKYYKKLKNLEIFNEYGAAEVGLIAYSEVSFGCLNLLWDIWIAQVNGSEQLLLTTLDKNSLFPLIRYQIGDRVEPLDIRDVKKNSILKFKKILGRNNDYVLLKNTNGTLFKAHSELFTHILRTFQFIDEFRIIQKKDNSILIEFCGLEDLEKIRIANKVLLKFLEKALDTKFKTKFIFKKVREIERTVAGKIKFIRRDL